MAELNARIIAKASGTASEEPQAADLEVAELAVNTADGKLFTKHTDGSVVTISGGSGGGASEINDLTDVNTGVTAGTATWSGSWTVSTTATNQVMAADGNMGPATTDQTNFYINDNSGTSRATELSALNGSTLYWRKNGGAWQSETMVAYSAYQTTTLIPQAANLSASVNAAQLGDVYTLADGIPGADHTPTDGQVLTWSTGDGEWQPSGPINIPVDSVNSQTGAVVLSLGDLDNVQDSSGATRTWLGSWTVSTTSANQVMTADGNIGPATNDQTNLYINDSSGTSRAAQLSALNGSTMYWRKNGGAWQSETMTGYSAYLTNTLIPVAANLSASVNAAQLGDVYEISDGAIEDGQVLTWVNANSQWEPTTPSSGGGAVSSVNGETGAVVLGVDSLDDVAIGQVVSDKGTWSTNSGQSGPSADGYWSYYAAAPTYILRLYFNDDSGTRKDADLVAMSAGDELQYSPDGSTWYSFTLDTSPTLSGAQIHVHLTESVYNDMVVNMPASSGSVYLRTASSALADGQVLTWVDANSQWEPVTPSGGGGATTIDGLTDVDTTTAAPSDGQVLTWVNANSQWEPATPSGGGGSSTLEGLTDTNFSTAPVSDVNFTSFDGGQTTFTDPHASATGGSIDSTLGTNAWKVVAANYYGDGSKLDSFLATDGRYDVVNMRIRSTQAIDTNNRLSLGGNKQALTSGGGYSIYTRNTGFGIYCNGGFQEVGTRPTMNADTWYEITWVADWGSAQRATKPAISLWVDGAIAVNNVTTTASYVELTGTQANDFRLVWSGVTQSNSGDKFWDDIRVYTSDTLPWGMTDATITDPAGQMDSTYSSSGVPDGSLLAWNTTSTKWEISPAAAVNSVNTQTGAVSLGIQDMDDFGLNSAGGAAYTYTSTVDASPNAGLASIWTGDYWAVNVVDNNGIDWQGSLYDTGLFVNGIGTVVLVNGSTVATTTTTNIGNRNSSRVTFTLADVSWHSSLVNGDEVVFQWTGFPTDSYTALANGDILQWVSAESLFKPAQLPASGATAIDGLSDVDTTTTPPTDGQVLTWVNANSQWEPANGAGSLGIQDLDDFELNPAGGAIYTYTSTADAAPNAGLASIWTGSEWAINVVDNTGTDWQASLYDTGLFANGIAVNILVNGVAAASTTTNSIGNRNNSRITFIFADTSWHSSLVDGDEITFQWTGFPISYTSLADGDLLQWNNTDQKFKPVQLSIDDLTDADTTTASPTDGQVLTWVDANSQWEPATPSGGGSVTSLDDVGDVAYAQQAPSSTWTSPNTGNPAADEYRLYSSGTARLSTTSSTGYEKDDLLARLTSGANVVLEVNGVTHTGTVSAAASLQDAGTSTERVAVTFSVSPALSNTTLADTSLVLTYSDEAIATVPPTDGQTLTWVAANSQWEPATPAASGISSLDPHSSLVTVLASFDGETNGSSSWTTYGSTSPTWSGGGTISNTRTRWGGTTSLDFSGSSTEPGIPCSLGSDDFTIEAWMYVDTNNWNGFGMALGNGVLADSHDVIYFGPFSNTAGTQSCRLRISNSGVTLGVDENSTGCEWRDEQWMHVALTRTGNQYHAFVNGKQAAYVDRGANSETFDSGTLRIGLQCTTSAFMQDFRVTRGVSRYQGVYYPVPTFAHPTS